MRHQLAYIKLSFLHLHWETLKHKIHATLTLNLYCVLLFRPCTVQVKFSPVYFGWKSAPCGRNMWFYLQHLSAAVLTFGTNIDFCIIYLCIWTIDAVKWQLHNKMANCMAWMSVCVHSCYRMFHAVYVLYISAFSEFVICILFRYFYSPSICDWWAIP